MPGRGRAATRGQRWQAGQLTGARRTAEVDAALTRRPALSTRRPARVPKGTDLTTSPCWGRQRSRRRRAGPTFRRTGRRWPSPGCRRTRAAWRRSARCTRGGCAGAGRPCARPCSSRTSCCAAAPAARWSAARRPAPPRRTAARTASGRPGQSPRRGAPGRRSCPAAAALPSAATARGCARGCAWRPRAAAAPASATRRRWLRPSTRA